MFQTVEEISKNKFINDLVNEAKAFGMHGVYVNYSKAENPQYNGIYFVCGYDANKVMDKNNNIEQMYMEQGRTNRFRADIHITKITDQSPFNAHQDIVNYCLHASTLRGIANKVGFNKTFKNVSTSFVTMAEMLYLNSTDSRLSYLERKRNEFTLEEFFKREGDREFLLDGETGDGPDMHMRPEKIDKKIPNMVSLEELSYKTLATERMVISYDMLEKMKQEFAKHPNILFFQAKPVITKLNMPDNQGFGSKSKNERSSVVIVYDAYYKKQVDLMYLKVKHPQCFEYSLNDIKKQGKGTCSFGVGAKDLASVFKKAKEQKIPICLDVKKLYFNCNKSYSPTNVAGYTVTIAKDDIMRMDNILTSEAVCEKNRRILKQDDIQKYSYNPKDNITKGDTEYNVNEDCR